MVRGRTLDGASVRSASQQACAGADTGTVPRGGDKSASESASTTWRHDNPCLRQYGYFGNATMVGSHWVTARGLRLGDPSRRLHVLYSPRRFTGSWAWLVTRYSRIGVGGYYPGLAAMAIVAG